jgi:hypothetical protein
MTELEALQLIYQSASKAWGGMTSATPGKGTLDLMNQALVSMSDLIERVEKMEAFVSEADAVIEVRAYKLVREALVGPMAGGAATIAATVLAPILAEWVTAEIAAAQTGEPK